MKPGRAVHLDEIYRVHTVTLTRTLRVVGISDRRVGAKLVSTLYEDLTPAEEVARARRSFVEQILARPKGAGRPTKRDRRQVDRWLP